MPFHPAHIQALAELLLERIGLDLREDSKTILRSALKERLGPAPSLPEVAAYIERLREGGVELRRLLPLVTVGKTSFFRDEGQFEALSLLLDEKIPELREEGRRLSIWSAGCASGEEAYSLAMLLHQKGLRPEECELLASDLNAKAVAFATEGSYPAARLADIPEALRRRYFKERDGRLRANEELREMVNDLRVHNLHERYVPLPSGGAWDFIFCRNVLIYFDLAAAQAALRRFFDALRPGGWLFLGYSESLFRIFEDFELVQVGKAFLYRKPGGRREQVAPEAGTAPGLAPAQPKGAASPPQQKGLAPEQQLPHLPTAPVAKLPQREPLQEAIGLIERGAFGEAKELLAKELRERPQDLGVLLTLANLYALLRLPSEAETCYEEALHHEPLLAEARLFFGMHLFNESQFERAAWQLSRAIFLDPGLAPAHYFLGRCHERGGDLAAARRSYRNASRCAAAGSAPRPLVGYYPDLPNAPWPEVAQAAQHALEAL